MAKKVDPEMPTNLYDCEYEAQLYGFSLLSIKNCIAGTMDDVIKTVVADVKPILMKKYQNESEVDTVIDKLTNAYLEMPKDINEKLEEAIKEFAVIDKRCIMASDVQFQDRQYSQEEEEDIDRQLEVLKRQRTSNLILANELKRVCDLLEPYDQLEDGLKNVDEMIDKVKAVRSDSLSSLREINEIEDIIKQSFPEFSPDSKLELSLPEVLKFDE